MTVGQRELALTVDLDASGTDAVLRTFFDQRITTIPVRERLDLQARRATDPSFSDTIGPTATGSTVTLRIRLAGDNINAIPITLSHDATGSIPASATTDPSGVAIVTYTAPASPTIELVTATLTENGVTSGDAVVITTREPIVVTVTPSFGFVAPGGTLQFTATVTDTTNTAVNWSATNGSIDANGLYTAGTTPGTFNITATSIADPTSVGAAFVQVVGTSLAGFWSGVVTGRQGFEVGAVRVQVLATPAFVPWFGFLASFTIPGRFVLRVLEPNCSTGTLFLVEVLLEGATFSADPGAGFGCFAGTRVTGTVSGSSMRLELLSPRQFDGSRPLIFTYALTRE